MPLESIPLYIAQSFQVVEEILVSEKIVLAEAGTDCLVVAETDLAVDVVEETGLAADVVAAAADIFLVVEWSSV